MMSMQDMFYSHVEPVWVIKPDDKKKKEEAAKKEEKEEEFILKAIPGYPYYYPPYNPPAPATKAEEQKKVTLRVSICCGECVERITVALKEMKGVKDVDCNIRKEKVIVTCTTAAPADVILESRKVFRHARLWTDDDE